MLETIDRAVALSIYSCSSPSSREKKITYVRPAFRLKCLSTCSSVPLCLQVAAIEPQCESESEEGSWSELPPPPELIVSYPGALSPIAEETGPQLSAYENDAQCESIY